MRVTQEKTFKPITITLETRDEADAFFGIVSGHTDELSTDLANKLCNWFSNHYQ